MPINKSDLDLEHYQQLAWQHRALKNVADVAPEYGQPTADRALAEIEAEMAQEFMALLPWLGSFSDKPLPFSPKHLGIYLWRIEGQAYTNVPHLVVHHAPDGFEWGYSGSGPTDLALNIIEMILRDQDYVGVTIQCYRGRCFSATWALRQDARKRWINTPALQKDTEAGEHKHRLSYQEIAAWVNERLPAPMEGERLLLITATDLADRCRRGETIVIDSEQGRQAIKETSRGFYSLNNEGFYTLGDLQFSWGFHRLGEVVFRVA